MDRNEVLLNAQQEYNGKDLVEIEAKQVSANKALLFGILLFGVVDFVEGFILNRISYGATMAVFAIAFTAFLSKYLATKKMEELIFVVGFGAMTVLCFVIWILQLCGVVK